MSRHRVVYSSDRLPPHSNEAEQGVLGSILCSYKQSMAACVGALKSGSGMFYDLRHQVIYEAALAMYDRQEPIDTITLQQKLADARQLEAVGGIAYLSSLMDVVPSAENIAHYLSTLIDKYVARQMIQSCTDIVADAFETSDHKSVDAMIQKASKCLIDIASLKSGKRAKTPKELVLEVIAHIEAAQARGGQLIGLSSGFSDLDKLTGGFKPAEVCVLAARPSCGKTSMALNIADHVATTHKIPVGFFSLEMSDVQLAVRRMSFLSGVDSTRILNGQLIEKDCAKLVLSAAAMRDHLIHIDDERGVTVQQLQAKARIMYHENGVRFFVIDYMQLLGSRTERSTRAETISDVSNGVKSLAKELDVPILVLSQLNRELDKDKGRPPRLSDLRESGAIEQDADLVLFLYNKKDEERADDYRITVEALLEKNRNGRVGHFYLTFDKTITKMMSPSKIDPADADVPWSAPPPYPD